MRRLIPDEFACEINPDPSVVVAIMTVILGVFPVGADATPVRNFGEIVYCAHETIIHENCPAAFSRLAPLLVLRP